jgi:hypothetical protein
MRVAPSPDARRRVYFVYRVHRNCSHTIDRGACPSCHHHLPLSHPTNSVIVGSSKRHESSDRHASQQTNERTASPIRSLMLRFMVGNAGDDYECRDHERGRAQLTPTVPLWGDPSPHRGNAAAVDDRSVGDLDAISNGRFARCRGGNCNPSRSRNEDWRAGVEHLMDFAEHRRISSRSSHLNCRCLRC